MARPIIITLAVQDAEKLKKDLESIGPAGEEMVRRLNASLGKIDPQARKAGEGVQLARYQMVVLGQQIQDVFVSLAGGQNPFLVMIQQGPQAASAVGGVGNALALLKPYLGPIAIAATAVAAGFALIALNTEKTIKPVLSVADAIELANRHLFTTIELQERAHNQKVEDARFALSQDTQRLEKEAKALRDRIAAEATTSNPYAGQDTEGVQKLVRDLALVNSQIDVNVQSLGRLKEHKGRDKTENEKLAKSYSDWATQIDREIAAQEELGQAIETNSVEAYDRAKKLAEADIKAKEEAKKKYEQFKKDAEQTNQTFTKTEDEIYQKLKRKYELDLGNDQKRDARKKAEDELTRGVKKRSEEEERAAKAAAAAYDKAIDARATELTQYQDVIRETEAAIAKQRDENDILKLLAAGYDENSAAVVSLKQAKEQAAVAAKRGEVLSRLETVALNEEAEAAKQVAAGHLDAAAARQANADEIRIRIDEIKKLYTDLDSATAEGTRATAAKNTNREIAAHFEQVLNEANRGVADVFNELFTGKITGIGDFLKRILARQAAEGLAEAFSPITASVLGAFIPGYSQYRLKQSTALTSNSGGGIFGSIFSGASNASTLYNAATNPGFFTLAGNPLATLGSNVSGFFGGSTLLGSGATLTGGLAESIGAAGGFGAELGAGAGEIAGSLTPLEATGYGAAIAAAAIILTSVFGGFFDRKPTPAAGALLDIGTGQITDVKTKALDDAYVTKAVQDLYPTVQGVIDRYGLSLGAGTRIGAGTSINKESGEQYFDLKLIGPDSAEGVAKFFHQIDFNAKDAASAAEAMSRLTLAIIQESDAAATAEGANVKAAAATLKLSDAASLIDKVLAGAERFDKGLGPLADQLVAINTAAREFAAGAVTTIKDYLDIGTRIGGEAGKAAVQVSRDYLDTLLGLKDAAPILSEAAAAFAQAKAAIIDLAPALAAANYSPDEIAARQAIATETVTLNTRNSFLRGLSGRNNPAQGQVDQLTAQYGADLRDAAALFGPGATSGAAAVNTSFAASVDTFLKSLQPDALAGVLSEAAVRADSASQYIAQAAAALVNLQQASQMAAQAVTTTTSVVDLAAAREARRQQILAGPDVITNTANFADARALIERGLGIFGSGIGITGLSGAASESYDALKGLLGQLPTAASSSTITKAQLLAALGEDTSARPSRDYYAELASKVANADSSLFKPTTDNGAAAAAQQASNVVPLPQRTFTPLDQPYLTVASRSLNDLSALRNAAQIGVDVSQGMTRLNTSYNRIGERQITKLDALIVEMKALRATIERRNSQPIVDRQLRAARG